MKFIFILNKGANYLIMGGLRLARTRGSTCAWGNSLGVMWIRC